MARTSGCFTIVRNEEGHILLVKRKDYPLWDLPGGMLEENEQLENCATREVEEETGYTITITRKIGEYDQPQYDDVQHIFLGEVHGGQPIKEGVETSGVGWFSPKNLPIMIIPNRRKQIKNFLRDKHIITKASIRVSPMKVAIFKTVLKMYRKIV
ncbi:NUDIX hydrolase [Priestia koreensis]|uniref:NUDIX hydrolase n=1 Tax=Priestia koreensis TaxID=284581 RepID=UPI001F561A7C|nr:NUDIX domain-containing protein [Priestia koreensis]MCM3004293.1 NUDIX domain-containing protein [Priestia koreensis]UNL83503.1 NUDIX domain-containing protein [Priestia koreensis]